MTLEQRLAAVEHELACLKQLIRHPRKRGYRRLSVAEGGTPRYRNCVDCGAECRGRYRCRSCARLVAGLGRTA